VTVVVEIVIAGGWLMLPIILCSILAIAIVIERFWTLNVNRVAPRYAVGQIWTWIKNNELDSTRLRELRLASPLGQILAAGLLQARQGRDAMNSAISQSAAVVIHELERYLSTLGTIAAITPLLGLLGTVIGMIRVFTEIMVQGTGNPNALAGGISEALITTAAGLCVAIPAYACHRFFVRRVDTLVLALEQESAKLVDALHGDRRVDVREFSIPKEHADSEKSA
jgi:biopolymer transport protein ExbB